MDLKKCPNCGAQVAPSAVKCEYCGSVVSDAPDMSWYRVDRQMPPADPEHPGRSIYVILLDLSDGITFFSKKTKQDVKWYEFKLVPPQSPKSLISAYYDFDKKKWCNDRYGHRLEGYKYSVLLAPTHWMYIPSIASSAWIAIADRMPPVQIDGEWIPEAQRTNSSSEFVLVCDKSRDFMSSVVIGQYWSSTDKWECPELDNNIPANKQFTVEEIHISQKITPPTHWMPVPQVGPVE